jgi:hypothetical protein
MNGRRGRMGPVPAGRRARRFVAGLLTGSFGRFSAVVIDLICFGVRKLVARARLWVGRDEQSTK